MSRSALMETQKLPENRPSRDATFAGNIELTEEDLEKVTGGLVRAHLPGREADGGPNPSIHGFQAFGPR